MFAHPRVVRATAAHLDLFRLREQPSIPMGHDLHHRFGQLALQHFDESADSPRALFLQLPPDVLRQRFDVDLHLVKLRSAHEGSDPSFVYLKVDHRTVADVSPTARQAIFKVAVALQVRTPRVAPESRDDAPSLDSDGGNGFPFLDPFGDFLRGLGASLSHGNVRLESVTVVTAHRCVLPLASLINININRRSPGAHPASQVSAT